MHDWFLKIYELLTNPFIQGLMGLIGVIAVIVTFLSFLYKKPDQDTPPTTETKRSRFQDFRFSRRYNQHVIFEHRVFLV